MVNTLTISGLKIETYIGVHEWEQRLLQPLLLDICISLDNIVDDDQLENTLDYDALCQTITRFVETHTFRLIETVAEQVAALIKNTFEVKTLRVNVSKPHAIKNANNVCISIQR